jgi:hypothetical protein
LREKTIQRTIEAVRVFQALASHAGAVRCLGVATSAVREATNGIELLDRIRDQTGPAVAVVSELGAYDLLVSAHGLRECLALDALRDRYEPELLVAG